MDPEKAERVKNAAQEEMSALAFLGKAEDTFLDHMAISSTMDEIFDHPIEVALAAGGTDIRPGIRIARPLVPESDFHDLTDLCWRIVFRRSLCNYTPCGTIDGLFKQMLGYTSRGN